MKKVTAIVPDDADLSALINVAVSLTLEKISDAEPPKKASRVLHRGIDGRTTQTTLMDHYTPEGKFMKSLAEVWLKEHGYSAGSASPAISGLIKSGHIRGLGNQKYIFVKPMEKTA